MGRKAEADLTEFRRNLQLQAYACLDRLAAKQPKMLNDDVIKSLWRQLAQQYGATVKLDIENCGTDHSASAGNSIFIGYYQDDELREISFFHELGHILQPDDFWATHPEAQKIDSEKAAWCRGLAVAKQVGITFSPKALCWAAKNLATYYAWEDRETEKLDDFFEVSKQKEEPMITQNQHDQLNDELSQRSGAVNNTNPLVAFLYCLMRDHVQPGVVEALVRDATEHDHDVQYCNGWLARYAEDLAKRLLDETKAVP